MLRNILKQIDLRNKVNWSLVGICRTECDQNAGYGKISDGCAEQLWWSSN